MQRSAGDQDTNLGLRLGERISRGSLRLRARRRIEERKTFRKKKSLTRFCRSTASATVSVAFILKESTDFCPPLKSALSVACEMLNFLEVRITVRIRDG